MNGMRQPLSWALCAPRSQAGGAISVPAINEISRRRCRPARRVDNDNTGLPICGENHRASSAGRKSPSSRVCADFLAVASVPGRRQWRRKIARRRPADSGEVMKWAIGVALFGTGNVASYQAALWPGLCQ